MLRAITEKYVMSLTVSGLKKLKAKYKLTAKSALRKAALQDMILKHLKLGQYAEDTAPTPNEVINQDKPSTPEPSKHSAPKPIAVEKSGGTTNKTKADDSAEIDEKKKEDLPEKPTSSNKMASDNAPEVIEDSSVEKEVALEGKTETSQTLPAASTREKQQDGPPEKPKCLSKVSSPEVKTVVEVDERVLPKTLEVKVDSEKPPGDEGNKVELLPEVKDTPKPGAKKMQLRPKLVLESPDVFAFPEKDTSRVSKQEGKEDGNLDVPTVSENLNKPGISVNSVRELSKISTVEEVLHQDKAIEERRPEIDTPQTSTGTLKNSMSQDESREVTERSGSNEQKVDDESLDRPSSSGESEKLPRSVKRSIEESGVVSGESKAKKQKTSLPGETPMQRSHVLGGDDSRKSNDINSSNEGDPAEESRISRDREVESSKKGKSDDLVEDKHDGSPLKRSIERDADDEASERRKDSISREREGDSSKKSKSEDFTREDSREREGRSSKHSSYRHAEDEARSSRSRRKSHSRDRVENRRSRSSMTLEEKIQKRRARFGVVEECIDNSKLRDDERRSRRKRFMDYDEKSEDSHRRRRQRDSRHKERERSSNREESPDERGRETSKHDDDRQEYARERRHEDSRERRHEDSQERLHEDSRDRRHEDSEKRVDSHRSSEHHSESARRRKSTRHYYETSDRDVSMSHNRKDEDNRKSSSHDRDRHEPDDRSRRDRKRSKHDSRRADSREDSAAEKRKYSRRGDSRNARRADSRTREERRDSRDARRDESRDPKRVDSRHRRRASSRDGRRTSSRDREYTPERRRYKRKRSHERRRSRSPPRYRRGRTSRSAFKGPKLFIGNISYDTTERTLEDAFSKFGRLRDVYIPRPARSRYRGSRENGFGFVTFERTEDATDALEEWDQRELYGNVLKVEYSRPRKPLPTRYRSRSRSRNRSYY